jgi:hypothetical protein
MGKALSLYDRDFYAWTQEQASLIKQRMFDKLDIAHLYDEVEDMGKHEKRELSNRLTILLMHLLKWKYQSSRQSKSWIRTIKEQRLEVKEVLLENPSLKSLVDTYFDLSYEKAVLKAADETNMDEENFPDKCEWTLNQILDNDFYPN